VKHATACGFALSSIVHATEDSTKVLSALSNLFPPGFSKRFEITTAKGHFGNEIKIFSMKARGISHAESFLKSVLGRLSRGDRLSLREGFDLHLDHSGRLHLRFDKQEAFNGLLVLGSRDAIKAEVSFESRGTPSSLLREKVARDLKELLS